MTDDSGPFNPFEIINSIELRMPPAVPGFLSVEECARIFRVAKMTVYRQCADGQIESIRIGKQVRIPTAALIAQYPVTEEMIQEAVNG